MIVKSYLSILNWFDKTRLLFHVEVMLGSHTELSSHSEVTLFRTSSCELHYNINDLVALPNFSTFPLSVLLLVRACDLALSNCILDCQDGGLTAGVVDLNSSSSFPEVKRIYRSSFLYDLSPGMFIAISQNQSNGLARVSHSS